MVEPESQLCAPLPMSTLSDVSSSKSAMAGVIYTMEIGISYKPGLLS